VSRPLWVGDEETLGRLVLDLLGEPTYGLDTEFHRERTFYPQLALVQLAWSGGVALLDPLAVDLAPLAKVLNGPGLALAHAAEQDLEVLDRACGAVPSRLFDTQLAAGFIGMSSPSLGTLLERLLGRSLAKADRLTDWTRRPLSATQRDYAASDVAHLLDLHQALVAELEALGRLAWAEDECALLLARARRSSDPEEAWWRLREARSLRSRSRHVAQAVAAWRERRAASLDRPPRLILSDLALISIAHHPPATAEDLFRIRGMEGRHLKPAVVTELLAAVQAGLGLPDRELRLPVADEPDRRLRPTVALASAWVGQLAGELRIDAALLATRADLQAFLRHDPDCRLTRGWRGELLGEPLERLVAGKAAVALALGGRLVLEERSYRRLGPVDALGTGGSPR
jgi:ribonuclease D